SPGGVRTRTPCEGIGFKNRCVCQFRHEATTTVCASIVRSDKMLEPASKVNARNLVALLGE
ncbi:MAG: hypothetical protein ACRC6I_21165, partial [Paracoccaceae bacterium]